MEHPVIGDEVGFTDFEGRKWRAECGKSPIDPCRIVGHRSNQDVEILGGTRVAVECDGISADDDELGSCIVERDEQVSKILGKLDHVERRGTKRHGIWSRV